MPHLIETMAYVGDTPWHGLGHQLSDGQSIDVWALQAGMAWRICETPVRFSTDSANNLDASTSFADYKVLFRSDTHAPLSIVGQRYQVVQPRDILEFYRDITDVSGFALETAGILKGGRKMWALAKTGQSSTLPGNDVTNAYVLLATACDGTLATTAQFTAIRVVCNNTLAVALAEGTSVVKVPHNTLFDPQAVKKKLGFSVSAWDAFMYRMKKLSERSVNSYEALNYFSRVFTEESKTATNRLNQRAIAKAMALFDGHGRGAQLASSKGTAFGLLNSVTEYIDYERRAKSIDHRLESAWFGRGAILKQKALDHALLLMTT